MFKLAPLPYAYAALSPTLSAETLELHHDKHHRTYIEKLNELVKEKGLDSASLEDLVLHSSGAVFNNAAQAWNHEFYWHTLGAQAKATPGGALATAIDAKFDSLNYLKKRFNAKAAAQFGSGWMWLVLTAEGELDTVSTSDADTPLRGKQWPLIACDVWEHAYYLDYRNDREKYLNNFWDIVNWTQIEQRYEDAVATTLHSAKRRGQG
jgi:superoxide dismutase, Fe-Mn family